jgi:hypothetical protein
LHDHVQLGRPAPDRDPRTGGIVNNSLAVSPDERLAVASYSLKPNVHVYDLQTERLVTTLAGFITPRNILFTPDGKHILISDSTRGAVAIVAADTLKEDDTIPIGAGAFGTAIDRAGDRLYVGDRRGAVATIGHGVRLGKHREGPTHVLALLCFDVSAATMQLRHLECIPDRSKQEGRRFPLASRSQPVSIRIKRVSSRLADSIHWIQAQRAISVVSDQTARV